MTDRLQQLLRQRTLIKEHLAWLDREIADASDSVPPLPPSAAFKPTGPSAPAAVPSANAADTAEKILSQFNVDANVVKTDARRGCLLAFSVAFGLFILAVIIGYYFYGRHLGRWW